MANKRKIGATIALDGEKEFKTAVSSCNKSLSAMRSEMNLVKAQTAGNANSLESLKKKHEVLTRTLDAQVKKEEAVRIGLNHAVSDYDRIGTELGAYKNKLEDARKKLQEMEEAGTASEEEMQKQRETVASLGNAVASGEEAYQKAGDRVNDWQKQLNNAQAQTLKASQAVDENAGYMKEAEKSTDQCAISIDNFGKKLNSATQETKNLNNSVTKFERAALKKELWNMAGEAAQKAASSAYQAARELDDGYDIIITKTGATGEALKDLNNVADRIFGDLPTDMETVGTAVGEVNTRFGQTGDALEKTSKQFIRFAEINGTDLNSSIDTTDKILTQFNLTAEDSGNLLGIMTARGQETGISVTSLMDSVNSNAATFKELNLGVEESINLMAMFEANGVDAGAALKSLKTAVNNYAKEGLTAREGLDKSIESIKNAETSTEALAIAQNTFGTKGAQVMADGIRSGRINLDTLSDSLSNYSNTVEDTYNATLDPWDQMTVATNNLKAAGSSLVGEFFSVAEPVISKAASAIESAKKKFDSWHPVAKRIISVLGVAGATAGVVIPKIAKVAITIKALKNSNEAASALKSLSKAQEGVAAASAATTIAAEAETAQKTKNTAASMASATAAGVDSVAKGTEAAVTETATVAQEGLNVAMSASPVLLLVAGVGALVGVVALLSAGNSEARTETEKLGDEVEKTNKKLEESQEKLAEAMNAAGESISKAQSTAMVASSAAEELANLADKTLLTNEEQSRMATLVGELNSLYPDMGLKIDSVTGKLNMGSSQIRSYVNDMKQMALAEAYTRAAADSYDAVVDATTDLVEAQQTQKKVTDELAEKQTRMGEIQKAETTRLEAVKTAEENLEKARAEGSEEVENYAKQLADLQNQTYEVNGETVSYSEAMTTLTGEIRDLEDSQKSASTAVEEYKSAVDEATATADGYMDAANQMNQADASRMESLAGASDARQQASQASITAAGQELEAYNNLSEGQQELAVKVTESVLAMQDNVQSALESQMNMFEKFDAGTAMSTDQMLSNMQSQIEGVQNWERNLAELADRGINEDLLQKLAAMGPDGAAYVQTFVNMSSDELGKANELWGQSVQIKGMTDQWGQELTQSVGELSAGGSEAFASLAQNMNASAGESGEYVVQGLVSGMKNAAGELQKAGDETGDSLLKSIDTSLGVASPSRKTMQTGVYVVAGLVKGMEQTQMVAVSTVTNISLAVINAAQNTLTMATMRNIGYNAALGLASGISQGRSQVITAASAVASAAITAAQNTLQIHSPSRVFRRIGAYTIEGAIEGAQASTPSLERTYAETARAAIDAYESQMGGQIQWGGASPYLEYQAQSAGNETASAGMESMDIGAVTDLLERIAGLLANKNGMVQNVNIYGSKSTAVENARELKKVGRELAFGGR